MDCPVCQFKNPKEMKLCCKCGSELATICRYCQFENPHGFKFCGNCGKSLLSDPDESLTIKNSMQIRSKDIQEAVSKKFQQSIGSENKWIEGEYKQVTILFCDMKSFTPLVEAIGPEEAYTIMDRVYKILIGEVHYYNGLVNELTGDGILAIFGAPKAMEDAPVQAIRSSIDIHRQIGRLNQQLSEERKNIPKLQMRVGINSGPVVIGSLGNALKAEYKVVGDTVNFASRLEGLADPGTTFVSESTFKLAKGLFRFESLGKRSVKGKAQKQNIYRLVSARDKRTRFDVSAEQGLTPLVGRQKELDVLFDAFERMKSSNGEVISVVSGAGLGKSRLLYEFQKTIIAEDIYFWEGRSLSYSNSISNYLIIDILKSYFNIQDETETEIREIILKELSKIEIDAHKMAPYFLELLSVSNSGLNTMELSPDSIRDEIAISLKEIMQKLSEKQPMILTVEDLHWADRNSVEILNLLFDIVSEANILIILSYRPEFVPKWGNGSFHRQLALQPLSKNQSNMMVKHIIGSIDSNQPLMYMIAAKTEGTPFFIEEFIKYLKERGLLEKRGELFYLNQKIDTIKFPVTIQDVIMARVDRLTDSAREILKIGSIIEREFSFNLIKRLLLFKEHEFRELLSELKSSELIFEQGDYPNTVYTFKHALIREVVYDAILLKTKKAWHEKVGLAIEELELNFLSEYYEVLARHFILGQNFKKGAEYSRRSCTKMLKTASPEDGIAHTIRRIECLEKLEPDDKLNPEIISARILLGLLYTQKNYHTPAMKIIEPILDKIRDITNEKQLAQLYTISGTYYYMVEEDVSKAFKALKKAVIITDESNDILNNVQARYWLGLCQAIHCDFEESQNNLGYVLELNEAVNVRWGISALKSVMSYFIYHHSGEIEKGFTQSLEGLKVAKINKDSYSRGMSNISHGVLCYCMGRFELAEDHLTKGIKICKKIKFYTWRGMAHFCLGELKYQLKQYDESEYHFNQLSTLYEKSEMGLSLKNIGMIGVIRINSIRGNNIKDLKLAEHLVNDIGMVILDGYKQRLLAQIYFNFGLEFQDKAIEVIQNAINQDIEHKMDFYLGQDYMCAAKFFSQLDQSQAASKYSKLAMQTFEKCGAAGWVDQFNQ